MQTFITRHEMLTSITCFIASILLITIILTVAPVSAASSSLHLQKIGSDGNTTVAERTVDFQWMEKNLPVFGDGVIHYYHQGPVFVETADARWNPAEDTNVQEKDMGAVKGSNLRDLCDLVGGMNTGDTVTLKAMDGFSKTFAYENVYNPSPRQGPMVITWFHADEGYVPDYATGMRLIFFADTSVNPWGIHAFGNWDWHESAAPEYWYFYVQGTERYPTTTGLSVQQVSDVTIHQASSPTSDKQAGSSSIPSSTVLGILAVVLVIIVTGKRR